MTARDRLLAERGIMEVGELTFACWPVFLYYEQQLIPSWTAPRDPSRPPGVFRRE